LARSILADLADALAAARQPAEFDPALVDLGSYEGRYALPGGIAHLEMLATEGGLLVSLIEAPDFAEKFAPVAPHTFCFMADPGQKPMLFFTPDPDGQIVSVSFLSHTFRLLTPNHH
jgi:hypothetical protein